MRKATPYDLRHANPNSIWSAVNIKKVKELKKQGLMMPKGIELFNMMDKNKLKSYSFERSVVNY